MLHFDFHFEIPQKGLWHTKGFFKSGLRLAILGPSGCGKSTFLRHLCGVSPLKDGEIKLENQDLNSAILNTGIIGYSPQGNILFDHLSVMENIEVPLKYLSPFANYSKSLRKDKALEILSASGLKDIADKYPSELSGGEKKRVSLMRSLVHNPKILVLDEPFSDLDEKNSSLFKGYIAQHLKSLKGLLIYVTHSKEDLELANSIYHWNEYNHELHFGELP